MSAARPDANGRGWPEPAGPAARVPLRFERAADADTLRNISAAARVEDTLFLSGDEHSEIERLVPDGDDWAARDNLKLADFLDLKHCGEIDLEGLAEADGWLWVLGSHAKTRRKAEKEEGETIELSSLADLKPNRDRCLLARLPLVGSGDEVRPVRKDGARRAGMLRQSKHGNALSKALKKDALLGPFARVPAKEGGIDIEGVAAAGGRVALGMRGPVIGTHALLIELEIEEKKHGRIALSGPPAMRLLAMEGLGIRDLKRRGEDLLILAGPTTGLSGPVALYRWPGWAGDPPQDRDKVRLHRPERLFDLPFGRGVDHPEALALWGDRILVVCDSPAAGRIEGGGRTVIADLFALPA